MLARLGVCLLMFLPLEIQAWDFTDEEFESGSLRYVADEGGSVAECRGFVDGKSAPSLTIPATVSHGGRSLQVVSIGNHAFDGTAVSSVTFSDGLQFIGEGAFMRTALTTVTVPATVTEIQAGAFNTNTITEAHLLSMQLTLGEIVFGGYLEHLYLSATTPPELNYYLAVDAEALLMPKVRVHVPAGSSAAYLASEWWAKNIIIEGEQENYTTVTTTRVGTLGDAIHAQGLHFMGVHNLTVGGPLDSDDIRLIRDSLTNIMTLDMSRAIISELPREAFQGCSFTSIKLPPTLRDMGNTAFGSCPNLEELVIPEGVQTVDNLVYNCTKLKVIDLPSTVVSAEGVLRAYRFDGMPDYSCTIICRSFFPPRCGSYPVFSYGDVDVKVRVPAVSASLYAAATGWKDLPQLSDDAIVPQQISVTGQRELNTDDLPDSYRPDMALVQYGNYGGYGSNNAFGALTVSGSRQLNIGAFKTFTDLYSDRAYAGHYTCELLANAPMTAQSVTLTFNMLEGKWYYMSFPFDVKLSDVKTDSRIRHWVVKQYSGANRAAMRTGQWQDVPYSATLEAGRGYIWFVAADDDPDEYYRDDLSVTVAAVNNNNNKMFAREDISIPLADYPSTYEHNASWNFVGNPYPCYVRLGALRQTMPVTVAKNGYGYEQYRTLSPVDDAESFLRPYEAFFVQKPADANAIVFAADGRYTSDDSDGARPAARAADSGARTVVNLTLTAAGISDAARIVINEKAKSTYERERDASKFFSTAEVVPQLYSFIGTEPCAINERPEGDGTIRLGVRTGSRQECTIALNEPLTTAVVLEDHRTGTLTDLNAAAYTFLSQQGRDDSRFTLHVGSSPTAVRYVATGSQQPSAPLRNLQGLPVGDQYRGIVIKNGKLTINR